MIPTPPAANTGAQNHHGSDRVSQMALVPPTQPGKPETLRPVLSPEKAIRTFGPHGQGYGKASVKNSTSPMGLILEALARPSKPTHSAAKPLLVPPVPMRYLSAFMLQSEFPRGENVDQRH